MSDQVEIPRYASITYVNAVKIKSQEPTENVYGAPWRIIPEEFGQDPIIVSSAFMSSHMPENGGYYIKSGDAPPFYMSAEAFEAAYTKV